VQRVPMHSLCAAPALLKTEVSCTGGAAFAVLGSPPRAATAKADTVTALATLIGVAIR
jgi:hypothetical protein